MQNTRVRNLFSTVLGAGVVAGGLMLSSCEDEFTEQDAIKAQQETLIALSDREDSLDRVGARINYTVTVAAAGQGNTSGRTSGTAFAEGATVTLVQAGRTDTTTTGKGGVAMFTNLLRGQATVTVEMKDHTTVTYNTELGSSEKENNSVGTLIPVFPLTVEAGATMVSGKAWAELDATNDMPEAAKGAKVRATLSTQRVLNTYGRGSGYGRIENATYQGFVQEAEVGDDGTYSMIIPNGNGADGNGLFPSVQFLPYMAEQKYVEFEDGKVTTVEKDVIFGSGVTTNHIKPVPSVFVEIEEPTGKAEGFTAKAELVAQDVSGMINNDKVGSGYEQTNTFELSADKDGNKGLITINGVDGTTGEITSYSYASNGAVYTEVPTITAKDIAANATGAEFSIDFTPEYQVNIENIGSGYWSLPEVVVVWDDPDQSGTQKYNVLDFSDDHIDITNGAVGEKGRKLNSFNFKSTMAPDITVNNPIARKASIERVFVDSNDGSISSVSLDDYGAGYVTSPKVTFVDANGTEVSAKGVATVNGGRIDDISVTNRGSGFKDNANDTTHDIFSQLNVTPLQQPSTNLKPGTTNVGVNFNYGTGAVQ